MTPSQKLKHLIILRHAELAKVRGPAVTAETVDALFDAAYDDMQDAREEVRNSGTPSLLIPPVSRHYDCGIHCIEYVDGSWVGFPFWCGGGKHGEPEAMPWINEAFGVIATPKVVQTYNFSKVPA